MNRLSTNTALRLLSCRLVSNGNGTSSGKVEWKFLQNSAPDILYCVVSNDSDIVLRLANVSKIVSFNATTGRHLASMGIYVGSDTDQAPHQIPISLWQKMGTQGGYIRGDGTNFNVSPSMATWSVTKTVSDIQFQPDKPYSVNDVTIRQGSANYVGATANRAIAKLFSGLTLAFGHRIINNTTMAAIGSNTTADVVDILTNTPKQVQLPNRNDSQGWPGANILTANAEINIIALVEVSSGY